MYVLDGILYGSVSHTALRMATSSSDDFWRLCKPVSSHTCGLKPVSSHRCGLKALILIHLLKVKTTI